MPSGNKNRSRGANTDEWKGNQKPTVIVATGPPVKMVIVMTSNHNDSTAFCVIKMMIIVMTVDSSHRQLQSGRSMASWSPYHCDEDDPMASTCHGYVGEIVNRR